MSRSQYFVSLFAFGRLLAMVGALALVGAGCGGGSSAPAPASGVNTFSSGGIKPEGIGIDSSDNVWVANRYSDNVVELSPKGAILQTITVGARPHGVKIDRAKTGNIWVMNSASGDVTALTPSGSLIGTFSTGAPGAEPQHAQFDSSGNIWITNEGANTVVELDGTTGAMVGTPVGVGVAPHAVALDKSGNFWVGNKYSGTITVINSGGTVINTITGVGTQPSGSDIDLSGNLWQAVQSKDVVSRFSAASASPPFTNIGNFNVNVGPRGVTIDGAGNIFVADQQTNDVLKLDSSGTELADFKVGACPENMAIDSKGDLWVSNACSNDVTELIGVATPVPGDDRDSNY